MRILLEADTLFQSNCRLFFRQVIIRCCLVRLAAGTPAESMGCGCFRSPLAHEYSLNPQRFSLSAVWRRDAETPSSLPVDNVGAGRTSRCSSLGCLRLPALALQPLPAACAP